MVDFKNNPKILFIPGWLDNGEFYAYKKSLDIWSRQLDYQLNFSADIVIAHSLGSLAALANWGRHKNFSLVLLNPVLFKKNLFWRWSKCMSQEGTPHSLRRLKLLLYIIPAFFRAQKLFKVPAEEIISLIPAGRLTIIYGSDDKYLCERQFIDSLDKSCHRIIEVKDSGHNYNFRLDQALSYYFKDYK